MDTLYNLIYSFVLWSILFSAPLFLMHLLIKVIGINIKYRFILSFILLALYVIVTTFAVLHVNKRHGDQSAHFRLYDVEKKIADKVNIEVITANYSKQVENKNSVIQYTYTFNWKQAVFYIWGLGFLFLGLCMVSL